MKVSNVYQPGQFIFYEGNPCLGLYCVQSGALGIRKRDPGGQEALVRLALPGSTLGHRAYFSSGEYRASASALVPSRVCFLDRTGMAHLLERDPGLAGRFLKRLALDLEASEAARLRAASMPVRARVASLLLELKDRFASVDDSGDLTIQLPLSRKEMASYVGPRPETIARTIRALNNDGVTHFMGPRVVVSDLDALLDEVEPMDPGR